MYLYSEDEEDKEEGEDEEEDEDDEEEEDEEAVSIYLFILNNIFLSSHTHGSHYENSSVVFPPHSSRVWV